MFTLSCLKLISTESEKMITLLGEPGRGPAEQHRPGRGAQPRCGGHPQHKVVNESLYCTSLLFREFMWNLHYMWSLPLKIVAIIGLVYSKLGFPAALVRDLVLWSDLEIESCLPTRHVKHVVFWNQTLPYDWPSTSTFKCQVTSEYVSFLNLRIKLVRHNTHLPRDRISNWAVRKS